MTVASVSKKFLYCFKVSYQGAVVTANSRTPRIICLLSKTTPIPNKKQRARNKDVVTSTKDFSVCADV